MKVLELKLDSYFPYPKDVNRIVKICKDNGYEIHKKVANAAWLAYSNEQGCNWHSLPKDDNEVLERVLRHTICKDV